MTAAVRRLGLGAAVRRLGLGTVVEPNSVKDDGGSNEARVRDLRERLEREIFLKLIMVEGLEACFCL